MRISRWLHLASTIVTILLVVALAGAVLSATGLRVAAPSGAGEVPTLGNNVVELTINLNLSNGGFLAISGFQVAAITWTGSGLVVGHYASPAATLSPHTQTTVAVGIAVDVGPGSPGQALLTQDTSLSAEGWVNFTLGYLIPLSFGFSPGGSGGLAPWNAPFGNYAVTYAAGSPGTVTVSFDNGLSIPIAGTMVTTLYDAGGSSCGSGSLPVDAGAGHPFEGSATAALSPGTCVPATAISTLSGPGYSFTLPEVTVG